MSNTDGVSDGPKYNPRNLELLIQLYLTKTFRLKSLKISKSFKNLQNGISKEVYHTEEAIYFMDLQEQERHLSLKQLQVH